MRVVIVGFPFCGKSAVFMAVSGLPPEHLRASEEHLAAVKVPEPRLAWLAEIYKPRKYTEATVDFVDLPGSTEGQSSHAGLTRHLPTLRQADGLLVVLRTFANDSVPAHDNRVDPKRDLSILRDEMLLADMEICSNRIEKLRKSVIKPTKTQERDKHELAVLERCQTALESEQPLSGVVSPGEEEKILRSFGFLTQKPMILVLNVGEADIGSAVAFEDKHAVATVALCASVEAEIIQLDPQDRPEFMADYGITALARDRVIRACLNGLGTISFFTVGEDEVRAWPLQRGSSAVEAAGKIHSDLARGFIRAEVVAYDDFHAAGSMREAKNAGKVRQEHKAYVVQDADIINIKFNV